VVVDAEGFIGEAGGASENRMKSLAFHGILPEIGSIFVFYFDFDFEISFDFFFIAATWSRPTN